MKKTISIILSLILLIGTITMGSAMQADAATGSWPNYAKNVKLDTWFVGYGTTDDPYLLSDAAYIDVYRFSVPANGTVTLRMRSKIYDVPFTRFMKASNLNDVYWYGYDDTRTKSYYSGGYYYSEWKVSLPKGTYYMTPLYNSRTIQKTFHYALVYRPAFSATAFTGRTIRKAGFTVKWKTRTNVTGYQIQYCINSSMKGAKTITINKRTTGSRTFSKLLRNRRYYLRIRSYRQVKVNGKLKTYYTAWTKKVSVPTK